MLSAAYLRRLREHFDYNQEDIAKKLAMSRPTYVQIEKGERELTVSELQKLAKLYGVTTNDILEEKMSSAKKVVVNTLEIEVPRNSLQKFKEVLLYILEKVGAKPNIGETAIYKLLYFIDFDYYEKFGEKLIGANYIKNHYGPTPMDFKKVISEMEQNEEVETVISKYFQYDQRKYLPRRSPNISIFNAREIEHVNDVLAKFSDKTGKELSDYSHEDVPWKITKEKEIIHYDLVFEREAPYAQRDYMKMWEDASLQDILKDLGPISQEESEYYFNLCQPKKSD